MPVCERSRQSPIARRAAPRYALLLACPLIAFPLSSLAAAPVVETGLPAPMALASLAHVALDLTLDLARAGLAAELPAAIALVGLLPLAVWFTARRRLNRRHSARLVGKFAGQATSRAISRAINRA